MHLDPNPTLKLYQPFSEEDRKHAGPDRLYLPRYVQEAAGLGSRGVNDRFDLVEGEILDYTAAPPMRAFTQYSTRLNPVARRTFNMELAAYLEKEAPLLVRVTGPTYRRVRFVQKEAFCGWGAFISLSGEYAWCLIFPSWCPETGRMLDFAALPLNGATLQTPRLPERIAGPMARRAIHRGDTCSVRHVKSIIEAVETEYFDKVPAVYTS